MSNFLTVGLLREARQYCSFCHRLGNYRGDLLSPEIKRFFQKKSSNWSGCPVCDGDFNHFSAAVKGFFSKIGADVDFERDRNIIRQAELGDECLLANDYFLDGLYRIMKGETFENLMVERKKQLQEELCIKNINVQKRLRKVMAISRKNLNKKIKVLKSDFEGRLNEIENAFKAKLDSNDDLRINSDFSIYWPIEMKIVIYPFDERK